MFYPRPPQQQPYRPNSANYPYSQQRPPSAFGRPPVQRPPFGANLGNPAKPSFIKKIFFF